MRLPEGINLYYSTQNSDEITNGNTRTTLLELGRFEINNIFHIKIPLQLLGHRTTLK